MLIGITGYARHGKDSVADVLVTHFGFVKKAFATPMKEACMAMFGWSAEYIEKNKDTVDPMYGVSPRQVLVLLGTEFGQYMLCNRYPDFDRITGRKLWAKRLLSEYEPSARMVVSDVRFPHEAEEIRARGGKLIRVYRPGYGENIEHESERHIMGIDVDTVIFNDGSLRDLEKMVCDGISDLW